MRITRKYRRHKRRARRAGWAALAAALIGILGGCSSEPELPPVGQLVEPSYGATTSAAVEEVGTGIPEAAYLIALDDAGIYYVTDQAALDLGYGVCEFLAVGGTSWDAALTIEQSSSYTPSEAGYITGAAIGSLCPEESSS